MLKLAVDGVNREYGIFADVGMTMLEAGAAGGDEGLEQLGFLGYLLKETESGSTDVFVWMLLLSTKVSVRAI